MPNWNPESGDPLSAPALSLFELEKREAKLWEEYLKGYFDGNAHKIVDGTPATTVIFPLVGKWMFQQAEMGDKELDGVAISLVTLNDGRAQRKRANSYNHYKRSIMFIIRALVNKTRSDGHTSKSLAREVSDLLFGLMIQDGLHGPLNEKGINTISAQEPYPITDGDFATRGMKVNSILTFESKFSP